MIHYHDNFDIVRQRQAEAEQAAAIHRSSRDLRAASPLRSGLARILIRAGEQLAPTPTPQKSPRPKVHLVTGWYSRSYRTSPNCC